jgi:hypothetical protein
VHRNKMASTGFGWVGAKDKLTAAFSAGAAAAVSGAKGIGKVLAQEALGASCLLEYTVGSQVASAGPGSAIWRVYEARAKKEGA